LRHSLCRRYIQEDRMNFFLFSRFSCSFFVAMLPPGIQPLEVRSDEEDQPTSKRRGRPVMLSLRTDCSLHKLTEHTASSRVPHCHAQEAQKAAKEAIREPRAGRGASCEVGKVAIIQKRKFTSPFIRTAPTAPDQLQEKEVYWTKIVVNTLFSLSLSVPVHNVSPHTTVKSMALQVAEAAAAAAGQLVTRHGVTRCAQA
jgi:hypothetical protein